MKKLLFTLLLLNAYGGYACSSCGCSASNQSIGLMSQIPYNFVGLQYQVRGFSTTHPDDGGSDLPGISHEYYNTFQVSGRYSIGNRIQLMAFVPYMVNRRTQQNVPMMSMSGIGDATLLANVHIIKKANCTWKHDLLVGGGLKMPTGAFDRQSTKTDEGLPNMQPGTHSWDMIVNGSYTVMYNALGANADASYTITTPNSDAYKYGNRLSANSFLFYKISSKGVTIIPQLGVSYDRTANDYTNYTQRTLDADSGNWQLYATAGIQALYRHIGFQARYCQPISQHYNSGLVTSWNKTEVAIFFLF